MTSLYDFSLSWSQNVIMPSLPTGHAHALLTEYFSKLSSLSVSIVKRFREPVGIRRPWRIWWEMLLFSSLTLITTLCFKITHPASTPLQVVWVHVVLTAGICVLFPTSPTVQVLRHVQAGYRRSVHPLRQRFPLHPHWGGLLLLVSTRLDDCVSLLMAPPIIIPHALCWMCCGAIGLPRYLMNFLLDATLGMLVIWAGVKVVSKVVEHKQHTLLIFGEYGEQETSAASRPWQTVGGRPGDRGTGSHLWLCCTASCNGREIVTGSLTLDLINTGCTVFHH